MLIPVVYPSAGTFWLNFDMRNFRNTLLQPADLPKQYELFLNKEIIQELLSKYNLSAPLKLLAPDSNARRSNRLYSCITRAERYPSDAFLELEPFVIDRDAVCRILLACPELCFLQAAAGLSFYETIKFGYDLCAMYRLDKTAEHGQRSRIQITDISSLSGFLDRAEGIYGIKNARHSLKFVRNCSNSPMETRLAMLQILPFSYGGFSIDGQKLNMEIFLSEKAAAVAGRKSVTCDMAWEREMVAVEYDSNETHLTVSQHDWDKRKATALAIDGYKVFPITSRMVSSLQEIEKTFTALRKLLGRRTDIRRLAESREKREELIRYLRTV